MVLAFAAFAFSTMSTWSYYGMKATGYLFQMAIPNAIGLYILARVIKNEIYGYRADIASGEIAKTDPVG